MIRADFFEPRPSPKKTGRDPVPAAYWMGVWCVVAFGVGFLIWKSAHVWPVLPEKPLQSAALSHKVKSTSVEEPGVSLPPEPEPIDLVVQEKEVTPEPPLLPDPPAAEPEPPVVPQPTPEPPVDVPPVEPKPEPKFELPKVDLPEVPTPEPPQVELPKVEIPKVEVPKTEKIEVQPVQVELPKIPMPQTLPPMIDPALLEADVQDTIPLIYLAIHPGETPMLSNWKTLTLCSLMTAATFVPAPIVEAGEKDKVLERIDKLDKDIGKSFEIVQQDIDGLRAELKKVKADLKEATGDQTVNWGLVNNRMKQLEQEMGKLRTELDGLKKRIPVEFPAGNDKAGLDEIKAKLGVIEQMVLKLAPTEKRVALSPPSVGRVLLVNLYNTDLLFVVNQKPFRVQPGMTLTLDNLPAGTISYEVVSDTYGLLRRSTTNLAASETFTLTAR